MLLRIIIIIIVKCISADLIKVVIDTERAREFFIQRQEKLAAGGGRTEAAAVIAAHPLFTPVMMCIEGGFCYTRCSNLRSCMLSGLSLECIALHCIVFLLYCSGSLRLSLSLSYSHFLLLLDRAGVAAIVRGDIPSTNSSDGSGGCSGSSEDSEKDICAVKEQKKEACDKHRDRDEVGSIKVQSATPG